MRSQAHSLLRFGEGEEAPYVVEPVGVHEHDVLLDDLNFMAEMRRNQKWATLYPDKLYSIAEYLAENAHGEIFVVNRPPWKPTPPGIVF